MSHNLFVTLGRVWGIALCPPLVSLRPPQARKHEVVRHQAQPSPGKLARMADSGLGGLFDDEAPIIPAHAVRLSALFEDEAGQAAEHASSQREAGPRQPSASSGQQRHQARQDFAFVAPRHPNRALGSRSASLRALLDEEEEPGAPWRGGGESTAAAAAQPAAGQASVHAPLQSLFPDDSHQSMKAAVSAALSTTAVTSSAAASVPVRELAERVWSAFASSKYFPRLVESIEDFACTELARLSKAQHQPPLPAGHSAADAMTRPCPESDAMADRVLAFVADCVEACRECPVFTKPPPAWVRHGLQHGQARAPRAGSPSTSSASGGGQDSAGHSMASSGRLTAFSAVPTVNLRSESPPIVPAGRLAPDPVAPSAGARSLHTARRASASQEMLARTRPVRAGDDPLRALPGHDTYRSASLSGRRATGRSRAVERSARAAGRQPAAPHALPGTAATSAAPVLPGTGPGPAPRPRSQSDYKPPLEVMLHAEQQISAILLQQLHPHIIGASAVDRAADAAFSARVAKLQWLTFDHLSLPSEARNEVVLSMSQGELAKIDSVISPAEKLQCVVAAADVLFKALNIMMRSRDVASAASADDFLPVFIAVVLRTAVPRLESNCRFLERYGGRGALQGKPGYCFVTLRSAMMFLVSVGPADVNASEEEWAAAGM